jgi:subtilase family serine protease
MRYRKVVMVLCTMAALAVGLVAEAGAVSASATTHLSGTASPEAAKSPTVAPVPASTPIGFEVQLNPAAGARSFAAAVSTPGSSSYRHYLTTAQWELRFSPTAGQVAEVTKFLRASGFAVHSVSADRMAIGASGTTAQVERAFGTSVSYHRVHGKALRLADRNLSVPAPLAGIVAGVTGVSQTLATPRLRTDNPATSAPSPASTQSGPVYPQPPGFRVASPCGDYYGQKVDTTRPPYGNGYPSPAPYAVCGYKPGQLRSAYNAPAGLDGAGETVAIIDAYASPTLLQDAQTYASRNDPGHPLRSSQFSQVLASHFTQGDECGASGWYGEQTLDVEAVHAIATGAHLLYVGAQNCGADLFTSLRQVVDGHRAEIVTNSWGDNGGDLLDDASVRAAVDNTLIMAAGTGITVLFSSGDNGDEFTTLGANVADYPPSSPWATAVGGTTLQIGAVGQRLGEFGWSTARSFLCNDTFLTLGGCTDAQLHSWTPIDLALDGGSGGGTSYVYPQPRYQAGVVPLSMSTIHREFVGADPKRVVPDISMVGDPATGFLVGETQTFPDGVYYDQYRIGGTSVSSPLFAGMVALADQAGGKSLGFLNPKLYALYGNSAAISDVGPAGRQDQSRADFANSINGNDGYLFSTRLIGYVGPEQFCPPAPSHDPCITQNVSIPAVPGYDAMTGLGAPGSGFVPALGSP